MFVLVFHLWCLICIYVLFYVLLSLSYCITIVIRDEHSVRIFGVWRNPIDSDLGEEARLRRPCWTEYGQSPTNSVLVGCCWNLTVLSKLLWIKMERKSSSTVRKRERQSEREKGSRRGREREQREKGREGGNGEREGGRVKVSRYNKEKCYVILCICFL